MNEINYDEERKAEALIKEKYKPYKYTRYDDSEYIQAPEDILRKAMNKTLTSAIQSCIYC